MFLDTLGYVEVDRDGNEWSIDDFSFDKINLMVGQNSTGKSRTLNVINALGGLLAGERQITFSGKFCPVFRKDDKSKIKYLLEHRDHKVIKETLQIKEKSFLERGPDGEGTIYAEELGQDIKFQVPDSLIASVAKRDAIQHPFFDNLYEWGKSLRFYQFGTYLGRDRFAVFNENGGKDTLDLKNTDSVVVFLKKGQKEFGKEFVEEIISDINGIGYNITEIGVRPLLQVLTPSPMAIPEAIYIKESEHNHVVEQNEISQGLFRALSLFIQLRFSARFGIPSLILIDDIGEGLDYERSTKLISSIIKIAKSSKVQLIMTTNNRFVMNNVPLEYWVVLIRNAGNCRALDYRNSKEMFDNFEMTGLSNFDFFSSKYYERASDVSK